MIQTHSSDGKNPLRVHKVTPDRPAPPPPTLDDYMVAIEEKTSEAIAAWPGSTYRTYPPLAVTQYPIYQVSSTRAAIDQAERLHRTLNGLKYSPVVSIEDLARSDPREPFRENGE